MRNLLLIILVLNSIWSFGQSDTVYIEEIEDYQRELNRSFANPEESPLEQEDFKKFTGLPFFPINRDFRIEAKFVRTPNQLPFRMPTTTSRLPVYEKYGEAHFELEGKNVVLDVYQSHELRETNEYEDYLFLPFSDLTNGKETYGGGRYLGLSIPEGDSIVIDFNKAYNPYCAYNAGYSCPKVPEQNFIDAEIKAGVRAPEY